MGNNKNKHASNKGKKVATHPSQSEPKNKDSSSETTQPTTFIVAKPKTLIVGNLSRSVEKEHLQSFFQAAGEIIDIRVATFADQTCSGSAQLEFASAHAVENACQLNRTMLMGRPVSLNFGQERLPVNPDTSSFTKPSDFGSNTVLISGFDSAQNEIMIKESIQRHFSRCGWVKKIHVLKDIDTGACVGVLFLEFVDQSSVPAALKLNETSLDGFSLHVEEA